jgi:hypothetical protein
VKYIVVKERGTGKLHTFGKFHESAAAARAEAERLVEKEGTPFLVFALVARAKPSSVSWTTYTGMGPQYNTDFK